MQSKKFTYHWVIVIACFLLMASSIGITTNCFNLFTVEIMNDLGYTASQVQLMASIATIMMLVGSLIIGPLMKKFSMRVIMPIFGVIISLSFFLYSRCNSLTTLYILSFFVGLGRSGVSVIPCGVLMNNWFQEKRGLATGIALAGSTGGGFVFVRIAKVIIASVGWRSAYMILGATAAIIIIPVSLFLIRENPSDKGLLPLGADSALQAAPTAKEEPKPVATGISRNKFLKTPAFWMLGILFFMISVVNMGVQSNISIYLSSQGHERAFIADVVSIVLLAQVPGKIILGQVYDKKGIKFGAVYCCVVYIVSIVALLLSANATMAIVFGVIVGLVLSMTTVTPPLVTSYAVGKREYSSIYGLLNAFATAGVAAGPVIASAIFDSTGSYNTAWYIFAVLAVVIVFITIFAMKKSEGFSEMTD